MNNRSCRTLYLQHVPRVIGRIIRNTYDDKTVRWQDFTVRTELCADVHLSVEGGTQHPIGEVNVAPGGIQELIPLVNARVCICNEFIHNHIAGAIVHSKRKRSGNKKRGKESCCKERGEEGCAR